MSKIAITADIHFGVPGRLDDIIWSCKVMREYCHRAGIDTVLVLGDLYHDRRTLEIDVLHHVTKFFEETKEKYNQNWIVFPGNHDMFLRHSWEINSLTAIGKNITIIEELKLLELDDRKFWVLPFVTYEHAFMQVISQLEGQVEKDDCLLTHIGIRGASYNTCFLLKDWSIVNFENTPFSRVYTGHFHNKQQIGENIWYPGSPIPFKFDEGDIPHGFYVYDLEEDTHKFINIWKAGKKFYPNEIAPPQFHTFLDELLSEKTTDDVNNNIIRVALQREHTMDEKLEIRQHLIELGARVVRWWDATKKANDKIEANQDRLMPEHGNLFRAFFESDKTAKTKNLDEKILFRTHDDVVREGDQTYTIEESGI